MTLLSPLAMNLDALTPVELALVAVCALAVVWVVWTAVRLTLRPGEEDPNHIKRMILRDDAPPAAPTRDRTDAR